MNETQQDQISVYTLVYKHSFLSKIIILWYETENDLIKRLIKLENVDKDIDIERGVHILFDGRYDFHREKALRGKASQQAAKMKQDYDKYVAMATRYGWTAETRGWETARLAPSLKRY